MINIGVDIEDISRFKDKTEKNSVKFLKKIYTKKELDYCFKNKNSAQHLAARFCAKEAVIKAASKLFENKLKYSQIEILNDSKGCPYVNILNIENKNLKIELSLSHEKEKAIAFVIITDNQ